MNYVVLVGKVKEIKDNVLNVEFKIKNDSEETMTIKVVVSKKMQEYMLEYLLVGDLVGIKGTLYYLDNEVVIKCDKLSFLSSKNNKESGE